MLNIKINCIGAIEMFVDKNHNNHLGKKFIKIEDVVNNWDENKILNLNGYCFPKSRTNRLFVERYKEKNEIRCSICGCKASHFRIDFYNEHNYLNLYGFYKSKDGNTEYRRFNLDHIKPRSLTSVKESIELGTNNFQPTCAVCNCRKGNNIGIPHKEMEFKCKQYKIERSIYDLYIQPNICRKLKIRNKSYYEIKKKIDYYLLDKLNDISEKYCNDRLSYKNNYCINFLNEKNKDFNIKNKILYLYFVRNICKILHKNSFKDIQNFIRAYIYKNLDEIVSICS